MWEWYRHTARALSSPRGWESAGTPPRCEHARVNLQRAAVLAVWAATVLGVVLIVALVRGPDVLAWLALALALAVVAGFVAQLAVGEQRGFVAHLSAATAGSFVLVLLGAGASFVL